MNACLQSLAHTVGLADYFLGYEWQSEINESNPLGFGGRVARAFGQLMEAIWMQKAPIAPVTFREALVTSAPMFAGNEQHDAQVAMYCRL